VPFPTTIWLGWPSTTISVLAPVPGWTREIDPPPVLAVQM
jgi:hypothetical protein